MRGNVLVLVFIICMALTGQNAHAHIGENETTLKEAEASAPPSTPESEVPKFLEGLTLSGQWFVTYTNGEDGGEKQNQFQLQRGYVTLKKTLSKYFSVRVTQDVSVDQEGDGLGDIEIRLKYGYLKFTGNDFAFFHKPSVEFGVVHTPFIDFEQGINQYRVLDNMYLERVKATSSADYGVTFISLFGGKVDDKFRKMVNSKYPGRYGSIAFGIYNGGGYHAIEQNTSKSFEGRLTLRPMPDVIPGLQLTYITGFGKGNTVAAPDWKLNAGFVSYENQVLVVTGQYYTGVGTASGTAVNPDGSAIDQSGYSIFTEINSPKKAFSVFGIVDNLKKEYAVTTDELHRYIFGIAYHFHPKCKILIDHDFSDKKDADSDASFTTLSVEFAY